MADKVAWRLRRNGMLAGLVSVCIRFNDLESHSQQHRFREPTADGLTLFKIAWSLVEKWWDGTPVRLIGITAGMLTPGVETNSLSKKNKKRSPSPARSIKSKPVTAHPPGPAPRLST